MNSLICCVTNDKFKMRLKELLSQKRMTIKDLSSKSGVHSVMIYGYLRGDSKGKLPSLMNLLALARALNCTLEELTGLEITKDIESDAVKRDSDTLSDDARKVAEAFMKLPDDDWRKKAAEEILLQSDTESENTKDDDNEDAT